MALDHIAKSSFANNFLHFVSVTDLVTLLKSVVTFLIIETVINQSFKFSGLVFNALRS